MNPSLVREKVQVWVIAEEKIDQRLVLLLKTIPSRGGFWQPVTGGVEPGETPFQAALREATEETGFSFRGVVPTGYDFSFESQFNLQASGAKSCHETVYAALSIQGALPPRLDPKEHDDFKWCGLKEARSLLKFQENRKGLESLDKIEFAPDFILKSTQGGEEKEFKLSEEIKSGPLLLAFYPGDFTLVCTKQLCQYRDAFDDIVKTGVRIVGLSPDSGESHQRFQKEMKLPFPLLSDPDKSVFKKYKTTSLFGIAGRSLFLVKPDMSLAFKMVEWTPITYTTAEELVKMIRSVIAR